jgi:hypothetical protein
VDEEHISAASVVGELVEGGEQRVGIRTFAGFEVWDRIYIG